MAIDVKVYNDRGALILPCRLTPRIMPGVVDIPQGAWYEPTKTKSITAAVSMC